jgi:hypothetical protein
LNRSFLLSCFDCIVFVRERNWHQFKYVQSLSLLPGTGSLQASNNFRNCNTCRTGEQRD